MSKAPMNIWIPVEEAIEDEVYEGYKLKKEETSSHFCRTLYMGNNTVKVYGNIYEGVNQLLRPTTWEEREIWNKSQFKLNNMKTQANLFGLFHDMYDVGDAYHEMLNSWIEVDFYEMDISLRDNEITLVGIAPAPYGCNSLRNPVAFVAETENGTRFWCHGDDSWVKTMREQMKDSYDNLIKGR